MGVIEGLTALGVIAGFLWIIFTQLSKKNPQILDQTKKYFSAKEKPKESAQDMMKQIYSEKRVGL